MGLLIYAFVAFRVCLLESSLDRELDAQVIGGRHLPLSSALWDKVPSNHQYHDHRSFDRRGYVGTPTEVHELGFLVKPSPCLHI